MQGQLHEIDVCSLLRLIELGQRTGELLIEADDNAWLLSFAHGRIVHASPLESRVERLQDFLHRLCPSLGSDDEPRELLPLHLPEYAVLWSLLEEKKLTLKQGQALVKRLVEETLFDILSLHSGAFRFEMGMSPSAQITTLSIRTHLAKVNHQLQAWKQLYPLVEHPEQCPVLIDAEQLSHQVGGKTFNQLARWADGTLSLRQLSRRLNRPMTAVAQAIYPFLEAQLLQLKPAPEGQSPTKTPRSDKAPRSERKAATHPSPPSDIHPDHLYPEHQSLETSHPTSGKNSDAMTQGVHRRHWIACIDDGNVTLELLKQMIAPLGHGVMTFSDPLVALGEVFRQPPDLILCDIDMPIVNGYEVCAMLRQTALFRNCPIVMLTGKDGFIDRTQARLAGATDYLTKPLGTDELLMLLGKYIDPGHRP